MTKLEEKLRKNGPGELVLKNGTHKQVTWDAEFLRKGLMGHGLIRGPLALPPEKARQLAEELNELAEKVESRAPPANH
jgi:hypothetical protein